MNGLDATRQIMMDKPIPIVIISAKYTKENVQIGFEAMEAGAVSIMEKPPGIKDPEFPKVAGEIRKTIRSLAGIKLITRHSNTKKNIDSISRSELRGGDIEAVAIGCSLGGPQALKQILGSLPKSFSIPIFVVQHIARGFGEGLVKWLRSCTSLDVVIPQEGQVPLGGTVYVAPDDRHMVVTKFRTISLLNTLPVDGLKPAVSVLFSSISEVYGPHSAGILLTGMGSDGSKELLSLHKRGAITIAQNEETSIAYGMPGSAIKLGAVKHILSLEEISDFLIDLFRN